MHDFRGAIPDDVYAQQLESRRIEDQFQKALVVAQHLSLGQLGIARNSNFIGDLLAGELLFRSTYHGDLGNRVHAVGNQVRRNRCRHAEDVATREPSLFHRGAGQGWKSDHVPRGIDIRHLGLKVFIDSQFATFARMQAYDLQVELVAVSQSAYGIQQSLALHRFSALQFGEDAVPVVIESYRYHFLPQPEDGTQLPKLETEAFHNFAVGEVQYEGALVEQGNLHAQGGEHRGILQPDDAPAHHDQLARQLLQLMYLVGVENPLTIDGYLRIVSRPRAAGDHKVVAAYDRRGDIALHFHRVVRHEPRIPFQHGHTIATKLRLDDLDLACHYRVGAEDEVLHRNLVLY